VIDLTTPGALAQLSRQIKDEIDASCICKGDEGPRSHLGASEIGHSCSKYLCFKFRHAIYKKFDGRMYRLLNRGHFEEPRSLGYLEAIDCKVRMFEKVLLYHPESESYFYGNIEEDNPDGLVEEVEGIPYHEDKAKELGIWLEKGKRQLRISACKGHFGGSLDAEIELPTRYGIVGRMLCELKTQGNGKQGNKISNFAKLVKDGVKLYKPVHWAQQCIYGYKRGLDYSLYMSTCKNDDELHIEVIKLDHFLGASLERKAELIIFAETPPSGVSMSPAFFECQWCDACDVCHNGKEVLKNCRSCKMCEPVEDANWYCHKWNSVVPKEHIAACPEWISYF
jgi:hypothetical protein